MGTDTGAWRIVGVSIAGTSHQKNGRDCEDSHEWVELPNGTVAGGGGGGGGASAFGGGGGGRDVTRPNSDGYINETTFLTADDALSTAQICVHSVNSPSFAVFTDGLQMLALQMPDGSAHRPFFTPLFQFAERISDPAQAEEELKS